MNQLVEKELRLEKLNLYSFGNELELQVCGKQNNYFIKNKTKNYLFN